MTQFNEIVPKDPTGPLKVLAIGRISTPHQNIENIEASYEEDERFLKRMYQGEMQIKRLGERGSGWKLNRATILEALDEIRTGRWDIVIMEDIGRAYRNPQFQYMIAHLCVDHDIRLICIGDGIDTADANWEPILGAAVMRHSMTVPETRRRVKRTATYAFHNGGMVQKIRFGYRRLSKEEAASGQFGPKGLRLAKLSERTPTVREMRERVLKGETYTEISDWLEDSKIPPGPYAPSGKWTPRLVVDFLRDPILHGLRTFRDVQHKMRFSTGEQQRKPNPEPETEYIPELAHMTREEQEELWRRMDQYAPPKKGPNKRKGTPRKLTFWPGGHLRCSICGDQLYWISDTTLKCRHAFRHEHEICWNRVNVPAEEVRIAILPSLLQELRSRPVLLNLLIDAAWNEFQRCSQRHGTRIRDLESKVAELIKDRERITTLLVKRPDSDALLERLDVVEQDLRLKQQELEATREDLREKVPFQTREEVIESLEETILHLARTSYAFGRLMRQTFPNFTLIPVQALDTTQVHPRVRLIISTDDDSGQEITIVRDTFQQPLQIRHAEKCAKLKMANPDWTFAQLGQALGIGKKAACDAMKYKRLMEVQGATDPYRELTRKPERAARWRSRAATNAECKCDGECQCGRRKSA